MSATTTSSNRAETLLAFCRKIGISDAAIRQPETMEAYSLSTTLTGAQLNAALVTDYEGLVAVFRESLSIEVALLGVLYLEIKNGVVSGDLQQAIDSVVKGPGRAYTVKITIAKAVVMKQLTGLDAAQYNGIFYFFQEKLVNLLSAPLLKLDTSLFAHTRQTNAGADSSIPDKHTLIVVSDTNVHFSGEMLTIVGESVLASKPELLQPLQGRLSGANGSANLAQDDARLVNASKYAGCLTRLHLQGLLGAATTAPVDHQNTAVTPSSPSYQEQITNYRKSAQDNPSLVGHQFARLTPLHFLGEWKDKGNGELETELARHLLNICILYTANRSTFDSHGEPDQCIYNSADRTATLNLTEKPTGGIQTTSLEALAKWLHSGKGTDQRTVLQNIVARDLEGDDSKASYGRFITRTPQLLKDAIWQYQVFVGGRITKHFEELQKVIGYISDVNKKISEALDSVTKSLTDALLATVGVLVLTVLAALVKKDASIAVFKISMQVYAGYLLFFATYRMGSILHSYWLLNREAGAQLAKYQVALQVDEIADLSSPLDRRRNQFRIWFWLTVVFYLVLAGSIYWAGNKGPQFLIDRGIITLPAPKPAQAS